MEEKTVKQRLLDYLKHKRITQKEFTEALGVSPTYIGAMRKGMPPVKMKRISELYPDLNRDWLLYGDGEMLLNPGDESTGRLKSEYETLLLPVDACAGGLQMWSQGVAERDCRKVVSPVSGADFAIPIKGDSMEPRFHEGSILFIKKINEKAFIPWGSPMVIDTENGVLVKNIYPDDKSSPDDEDGYVIAKSLNPQYPPIRIPTSSIYGIYRVIGSFDTFMGS